MRNAIEVVGRLGRWVLEAALSCIIGMILFSAAGVMLVLGCMFTSLDPQPVVKHLPASGWWLGFAFSLFRLKPCLRKPFGHPIAEGALESEGSTTSFTFSPSLAASLPLPTRVRRAAKGGGIGWLLGAVAAIALSIYLCIVVTAVIDCPLAPKAWSENFVTKSVDTAINNDSVSFSLWHPLFGKIVGVCLVSGITLGTFAGVAHGLFAVDSEPTRSENPLG